MVKYGDIFRFGGQYIACYDSNKLEDLFQYLNLPAVNSIVTDPPYNTTDIKFDRVKTRLEVFDYYKQFCDYKANLACFFPIELLQPLGSIWHKRFWGMWVKKVAITKFHNTPMPPSQFEPFGIFDMNIYKGKTFHPVYYKADPYKKVIKKSKGYKRGGQDLMDRCLKSNWSKDGYVIINEGKREYTDTIVAPNKIHMKYQERTKHITQKPLLILKVIIQWISEPEAFILDPFGGSCSTSLACELLNRELPDELNTRPSYRKSLSVEIEPEFVEWSIDRVSRYDMSVEYIGNIGESK